MHMLATRTLSNFTFICPKKKTCRSLPFKFEWFLPKMWIRHYADSQPYLIFLNCGIVHKPNVIMHIKIEKRP